MPKNDNTNAVSRRIAFFIEHDPFIGEPLVHHRPTPNAGTPLRALRGITPEIDRRIDELLEAALAALLPRTGTA